MIKPLGDRLVVEPSEAEALSPGGIVLPDTAAEEPRQGYVRAVGPGRRLDSGQIVPLEVKVGDKVVFSKFGGTDIKINGKEYKVLRESDVLAILTKDMTTKRAAAKAKAISRARKPAGRPAAKKAAAKKRK